MAFQISGVTLFDENRREQNARLTTSVITSNTAANGGIYYYLNAGSVTLTLPSSPTVGDQVGIAEISGNTTSVIARNGSNIMSLAENLELDLAYASFKLVFVDSTRGWVFT